ncbi:MAG: hypothetical protein ACFE7R_09035, partial [Candidatus Hodarchaeota archaeon]
MTKRKESSIDVPATSRESTKKTTRKRKAEVQEAKLVLLKEIGYPFRLKGDPKPTGLEIDNQALFRDYAREQWIGSLVKKGTYLFDRYIMPDYAFQVVDMDPEEAIIARTTQINLQV